MASNNRLTKKSRIGCTLSLAILLSPFSQAAFAVKVPDAAQAGANDPARETRSQYSTPSNEVFLVPPLNERPLGIDEGERLFVKSILLRGAINRPESGIYLKEVRALVENQRFMTQKLDNEISSGFTRDELELGAKLLRELLENPDKSDENKAFIIEQLVSDLRFKMQERRLTIGQLQQIADEVSRYYRSKGFILAQVYLPSQTVRNGEVVIQVMEGIIGNIIVQNNKRYSADIIKQPFSTSVGKPANKQDTESGLLQLSDYPGLSVLGIFQPGKEVGSSDLVLNVRHEKAYQLNLRFDDYGSIYTGEYRPQVSYTYNNITQAADTLNIALMNSYSPDNSLYWALSYQRPIVNRHNKLIFSASRTAFDLGANLAEFGINGSSKNTSLAWRHSFMRSRTENHYSLIDITQKRAELSDPLPSLDELAVASFEYGFDIFDFRFSGVNIAWIKYSQGLSGILGAMDAQNAPLSSRQNTLGVRAGSEFSKLEARYDRLQTLSKNHSLLFSLYGQYSTDLLTASEQFTIGGPKNVRAYPVSEFLMDSGYSASLEWMLKAPGFAQKAAFGSTWGQIFQLVFFTDIAAGSRQDPLDGETGRVYLHGAGIGARIKLGKLSANIDFANIISAEEASDKRSNRIFLKLDYAF